MSCRALFVVLYVFSWPLFCLFFFDSYCVRNQVYSNKRQLKQNEDGIFVTENLTQFRTSMTKTLSKLKYEHKIHAYWTSDGHIFAKKKNSEGRKKIIINFDDIEDL